MQIPAPVLAGIYTLTGTPETPTTLNAGPRKYTARLTLSRTQVNDQPIDAYGPICTSRLPEAEAKVMCWGSPLNYQDPPFRGHGSPRTANTWVIFPPGEARSNRVATASQGGPSPPKWQPQRGRKIEESSRGEEGKKERRRKTAGVPRDCDTRVHLKKVNPLRGPLVGKLLMKPYFVVSCGRDIICSYTRRGFILL
jgi:hypothetical protein